MKNFFFVISICVATQFLFAQNQPKIDSLKQVVENAKEDTNKINTLNELSRKLWQTGDYDQAKKYAEDALALSHISQIGNELAIAKGKANAYNNLGIIYWFQSNYSEGLKNHMASLKIREKIQDKQGIASSYNNIGLIYEGQSNYTEALRYHQDALKIREEIGNKRDMATSYMNISNIYIFQGNYHKALQNQLASLKIREEIEDKQGIANCYSNIGIIYDALSNYDEALKNYFASLKLYEELGDKRGIASSYSFIGNTYINQGNYNAALKNHLASLKIREEIKDKSGVAESYENIGIIYERQGDYSKALKNQLASLQIRKQIDNKRGFARSNISIGNIHIKHKNFVTALGYLSTGLSFAKETGIKLEIKEAYSGIAKASAGMGDYKKAFEYHQLYSDLKDSLLNEVSSKQIAQMKEQYESDKKDQQILVLNKDKELQAQEATQQRVIRNFIIGTALGVIALLSLVFYQLYRRRQIKSSLEINQLNNKVLRAQLNPHFIFNALNSIRNYIQQHADLADGYLARFSTLMRQVLENSEEEKISLQEEIAMLENYMELERLRLPLGFDYEISLGGNVDAANTMIPPMILQPMVENAIWHGLKPLNRRGKITLRFIETNGLLDAVIEDDGIGLGSATVETTNTEKKRSMGMQITRERISLLNRKAKVKGWLKQKLFEQGSQVEMAIPV